MSSQSICWLADDDYWFPDLDEAWKQPNGLLAAGGDLSPERLVTAYRYGIFPWFNENEPILWWSPDPRCVLKPENFKVSRSLKKSIRKNQFRVTYNQCFTDVMEACAAPRPQDDGSESGTWISPDMVNAYTLLHSIGYAHSVEVWQDNQLVGGLYGLAMGKIFFGESMFSKVSDASKTAMLNLCETLAAKDFRLIDGQVYSAHLETLGFELIPRRKFRHILDDYCKPDQLLEL